MKIKPLLSICCSLIVLISCTSPTKDFDIHINPAFYEYVVEVELEDIANPNQTFSNPVTISISGQDASSIYNIDGTKNYELNFGSLQLIVAKDNGPIAGNPLLFTVQIESNGYRSSKFQVEIEEEDYFLKYNVGLIDQNNLPIGLSSSSSSGTVTTNGQLSSPLLINAGSADSTSRIRITIPTDIEFKDAAGNSASSGQLNVDILSLSDTSRSGQAALPNGGGLVQTVTVDGEDLDLLLEPSATFEIDMTVGNTEIKQFTGNGISTEIGVPNILYNEDANRNYQSGDSISLISFTDGDVAWQGEGTYEIQSRPNGDLFIQSNITHLSFFKLIGKSYRLRRFSFKNYQFFNYLQTNDNGSISGDMRVVMNFSYGSNSFNWPFTFSGVINNTKSKWLNLITSNKLALSVAVTNGGNISPDIYDFAISEPSPGNVEIQVSPKSNGVDVSFSLYCAGDNTVITPPAGVKMFYREHNGIDPTFNHLYTFTQSNSNQSIGHIYQLEDGKYYDFRALFGDEQIDTANVFVEDNKHYQVILPQDACNEIL